MSGKRDRHAAVRRLIEERPIASQEELRKLLRQRGWDVTQSTLSRDLRELGVGRLPTHDGGVRYSLPEPGSDPGSPSLETLLPPLFVDADGVGELLVVHTHRGGAQPVAEAIDMEEWPELLGSIAGDDTILLICRSSSARQRLLIRLRELARGA
jgi:transcriptional regulator of arginine metabolism